MYIYDLFNILGTFILIIKLFTELRNILLIIVKKMNNT